MAGRALKIEPDNTDTNQPNDSTGQNASETANNENVTAALAYLLWHERGCPIGSSEDDWFQAEQELQNHRTGSTEQPYSERPLAAVSNANATCTGVLTPEQYHAELLQLC
jgi:hypothetical protein